MPRLLEPARQIRDEDELYVYHSKCNLKPAINGAVFQWHQDYGHWKHDGVAEPDLTTALIMLDSASQLGGCAYFIPGSHKQIGRASCRERVCQYVSISVVAVPFTKKATNKPTYTHKTTTTTASPT